MIRFSFVTVAKGRYETFTRSCAAIWDLAYKPEEVEHIILYDGHDSKMGDFCVNYKHLYPNMHIHYLPVALEDYNNRNMHKDYWNPGANSSFGEIIFGLCNDTIVTTKNYDKIMLDALSSFKENFGHSVVQFLVDDDSGRTEEYPKNWFCSWIILSQRGVMALNGLAPKELPFQGADRAVYQIFTNTIRPAQINLRDQIHTEHISHYTGRSEVDEITRHRAANFNRPCILSPYQMQSYINRVNQTINEEVLE